MFLLLTRYMPHRIKHRPDTILDIVLSSCVDQVVTNSSATTPGLAVSNSRADILMSASKRGLPSSIKPHQDTLGLRFCPRYCTTADRYRFAHRITRWDLKQREYNSYPEPIQFGSGDSQSSKPDRKPFEFGGAYNTHQFKVGAGTDSQTSV